MAVGAYSFFTQKGNSLLSGANVNPTKSLDGAVNILALEVLQHMGLEALTGGKPIFVMLNSVSIFGDMESQCEAEHDKIIFLIDNNVPVDPMYINRIRYLKEKGYKFAIRKLTFHHFTPYKDILVLMDYILLDDKKLGLLQIKKFLSNLYPTLKIIASNIETTEIFQSIKNEGFDLYEGRFYRLPMNVNENTVSPLKINYIQLLNVINEDNFELSQASNIIQRDPALAISLLKFVNSKKLASEVRSLQHAAAILGQKELKKWINAAVTNVLYSDKPNEITKLSLIRAKFAENLAPVFEMGIFAPELFMMGLFSVLDIILEMPIQDAVNVVIVPKEVKLALVEGRGRYAQLLSFIRSYETADWQEISRQLLLNNIPVDRIYDAYIDTLQWYSNLLASINS